MINTKISQKEPKIILQQQNNQKTEDAHGDVRQDKRAKVRARTASLQPAQYDIPMRAQTMTTKKPRLQKPIIPKRRTAQLTLWVEPRVKAEILRRVAESNGKLTPSSAGAALLKRGMQADLDMEYGALLTPVFESVLKRYMTARDNRMAILLVRACIAIEQTRNLTVNVLGRQPKISPAVLNDILDHSLTDAKKKLTNRSPELNELIKELNRWIVNEEK